MAWSVGVIRGDDRWRRQPARLVGATNHCMHGKDEILERILDWRPFDYVTLRSTMQTPGGPVTFDYTLELEPTPNGTIVHMRFAPPETDRERAIMSEMRPMFEGMFEADRVALRTLLELKVAEAAGSWSRTRAAEAERRRRARGSPPVTSAA
jgi:hypothetical protein